MNVRIATATIATTLMLAPVAFAQDAMKKTDVEKIVHDYLMENPKVILDSIQKWQVEEQIKAATAKRDMLAKNADKVFKNPSHPVAGNKEGDVTLAEFFDYNCGYCKKAFEDIDKLIKQDKNLRVAFIEYPIFGADSVKNAMFAQSVSRLYPAKYYDFHAALMRTNGKVTPASVEKVAKAMNIDVAKIEEEMKNPEVQKAINDNKELAKTLGVSGTPGFAVGKDIIGGAVGLAQMKEYIRWAREGSSATEQTAKKIEEAKKEEAAKKEK